MVIEFAEHIPQKILDKFERKGRLQKDELGYEKYCGKCNEYWALTSEFWYKENDTPLLTHCWCKACYRETRRAREANK